MTDFTSGYFDDALFDLEAVINTAEDNLATVGVDFDTIVGTGFSGACVIPALALTLGKNYVLIRKETDTDCHHRAGSLVGKLGSRWIFVDDFISSGATRDRVIRKVNEAAGWSYIKTTFVGTYLYIPAMRGDLSFRTAEVPS